MFQALLLLAALAGTAWTASFLCGVIHYAEKLNTIFTCDGSVIFLGRLALASLSVTAGTFAAVTGAIILGQRYLLTLIAMNGEAFLLAITLAFFIAPFTTMGSIINRRISCLAL